MVNQGKAKVNCTHMYTYMHMNARKCTFMYTEKHICRQERQVIKALDGFNFAIPADDPAGVTNLGKKVN